LKSFCFTPGTDLGDILWIATVFPYLKNALPQTRLICECPAPEFKSWLERFPELDEVIGDVEGLPVPPDTYAILHPFWHPVDSRANTPLKALFLLVRPWIGKPESLPSRPYAPQLDALRSGNLQLPEDYICFDPRIDHTLEIDETLKNTWTTILAYLAIPAVQLGPDDTPLLPGVIDGRGQDILEAGMILSQARLFIGGDSGFSVLACAMQKPQVWLYAKASNWWWPRGSQPECLVYPLDNPEQLNLEEVLSLAWEALDLGGGQDEI
jgi:hypothetical protein